MSNIGEMTVKGEPGSQIFLGRITSLTYKFAFRLMSNANPQSADAPSHLAFADGQGPQVQVGVAWQRTLERGDQAGQPFFSMVFDDPSFLEALTVSAFPRKGSEGWWDIVWRRQRQAAAVAVPPAAEAGDSKDRALAAAPDAGKPGQSGDEIPF